MQHGSTPPGGQPEDSGGWTGGGGGRCVALRIRVQGGSPLPCLSTFPALLRQAQHIACVRAQKTKCCVGNRDRLKALMD